MTASTALRRGPLVVAACLILAGSAAVAQEPSAGPQEPGADPSASPAVVPSMPPLGPLGAWDVVVFDPWGEGLLEPLPGSSLTVVLLGDDRLEGDTMCGRYFGGYALDGDSLSLGVVSLGYDACDQAQREESVALSTALGAVTAWRPADGGLELLDEAGATRLALATDSRGGGGPAGTWAVERYLRPNGRPVEAPGGASMSLTLEPGGEVSGTSGCRYFEGAWTTEGDGIAIGPLEAVGLPCEGAVRRGERQLLRAIGEAVRWARDGDALVLIDAFGLPVVELRASDPDGEGSSGAAGEGSSDPDGEG